MAKPSDLMEWTYVPSLQRPLPSIVAEFMQLRLVIKKQFILDEEERFHLAQGRMLQSAAVFLLLYVWPLTDLIPIARPRYFFILEFLFLVVAIVIGLFTLNTYIVHKLRKGESTKIPVLGAMADMAKNSNFWFVVADSSPFILFFVWMGLVTLLVVVVPAILG